MKEDTNVFARLPPKLVDRLMPFQRDGVEFAVRKRGRCLIADEMGLGKTLQAISVAYYYRDEWPLLIIIPSSLRYSWIEEFEKWLPDIDPGDVNLIQSGIDISGIETSSVTLVTYGLLSKGSSNIVREALKNRKFQVVIVDESHYIRNIKTASCKAIVPLVKNANRRILLSGTPALAKPVELYPQIDAVCPGEFGSWSNYTSRFCDARLVWMGRTKLRKVDGASNLQELQALLSDKLMIRREKSQVLKQLPPKQRQKVLFNLKDSDVKKEILRTFDELRPLMKQNMTSEPIEVLTGGANSDSKDLGTLSLIQRLYRLSGDAKIGPAKEYVEMLCENPNLKFLVFAYHHNMMNGLTQSLYDKKVKFIRIDGETPPSERPQLVNQFQSDPDTRVAILSILAAGVGLTLTAATLVVFAEMYWTPGVMLQCEDRAHRIGQSQCVSIHYLVAKDTMDEWVWSAVCRKTIVTSTTLTGHKQVMKAEAGHQYQVEVLSNAEAWVPKQNEELDLSGYFESQQSTDQKSILQYFSSSQGGGQHKNKTLSTTTTPCRQREDTVCSTESSLSEHISSPESCGPPAKKARFELLSSPSKTQSDKKREALAPERGDIVLIDSDTDNEDFQTKSLSARISSDGKRKNGHSKNKQKQSSGRKSLSQSSGNSRIAQMFSKVTSKSYDKDGETQLSIDLDDDEISLVDSETSSQSQCTEPQTDNIKQKLSPTGSSRAKMSLFGGKAEQDETEDDHKPAQSDHKPAKSDHKPAKSDHKPAKSDHKPAKSDRKPAKSDHKPAKSNQWSCNVCTFLNHKDIKKCEICDSPKACKTKTGHKHKSDVGMDKCSKSPSPTKGGLLRTNDKADVTDIERDELCFDIGTNELVPSISEGLNQCQHSKCKVEDRLCLQKEHSPRTYPKYLNNSQDQSASPNISSVASVGKFRFKRTPLNSPTPVVSEQTTILHTPERNPAVTDKTMPSETDNKTHKDVNMADSSVPTDCRNRITELSINSDSSQVSHEESHFSDEIPSQELQDTDIDETKDGIPVYRVLRYRCSKYTGRIFLLDETDTPLNANFIPIDIEVGNHDNLPNILQQPSNLRLVQRFCREWQSLTETKKRVLIKACHSFISPIREYESLRSCQSQTTQRHKTKVDTSAAAVVRAAEVKGRVRVITKDTQVKGQADKENPLLLPGNTQTKGIAQVVGEDGIPLCVNCQKPYSTTLLDRSTITSEDNAWQTRFCSQQCSHQYWMQTNSEYCRDMLYEAERGVCQLCQLDAQSLYKQVRDTTDHKRRADLVNNSKLGSLSVRQKQQMVTKPVAGAFWHADHIVAVFEGGGQCDLDNLRTLCVVCHQKVTTEQAKKRARVRKFGSTAGCADISAFFQKS